LRRDNIVVGVTTAATLWLVTVIGLCLGGGQIVLGLITTGIGLFALWPLRWVESWMRREYHGQLSIELDPSGPAEAEIRRRLGDAGLSVIGCRFVLNRAGEHRELTFEVSQVRHFASTETPALLRELAAAPGVVKLQWDGRS
jgi:putative Mg2+ transporter-C (MgtC) family protein